MRRIQFTQVTIEDVRSIVALDDGGLQRSPWDEHARAELTPEEQRMVDYVSADLRRFQPSLVNDATVFARSIYPLLVLAERDGAQALAGVSLAASVGDVELVGVADGAIGRPFAGEVKAPFLVVVEAKRGVEGINPVAQLYAELLTAALLNAQETGRASQRLYGCYTVADSWTFVEMSATALDSPRPSVVVVTSPELSEKTEATTIARTLKSLVATLLASSR
jgi:hypothetical protein